MFRRSPSKLTQQVLDLFSRLQIDIDKIIIFLHDWDISTIKSMNVEKFLKIMGKEFTKEESTYYDYEPGKIENLEDEFNLKFSFSFAGLTSGITPWSNKDQFRIILNFKSKNSIRVSVQILYSKYQSTGRPYSAENLIFTELFSKYF